MEKKKEKKSFNKKKAALLAAAIIAGGAGIGGATAYFSAQSETRTNKISIATGSKAQDGGLTVVEDKWDHLPDKNNNGIPDEAEELQPGGSFTKDPAVKSNVNYPAYMVVKVSIPKVHSKLDGDTALGYHQAFLEPTIDTAHFTKMKTVGADDTTKPGTVDYYYAYKGALPKGATSATLFTKLQEQQFTEVDRSLGATTNADVKVTSAAIQTTEQNDPSTAAGAQTLNTLITEVDSVK